MSKKKQTIQANDSSNSMAELSDEDLQQVVGGILLNVEVKNNIADVKVPVSVEAEDITVL